MKSLIRDTSTASKPNVWQNEINDLIGGASGGFLFGIPLIYTMEVWWIGSYTEPPVLLLILAITYGIVFLLNRTDGFRQNSPDRTSEALMDSVEAIAIGLVCNTIILILLREIDGHTPLEEALGKIILESIPFSIGVGLARSILKGGGESDGENGGNPRNETLSDLGSTAIGALFIAMSIAPTDEIPMLAAATSEPWLLAIIAASLIVSYAIVFASGFTDQSGRNAQEGLFQNPLEETVISYLVSLIVAAALLAFFHRLTLEDPWTSWLEQTIVLGLPATVGGAAGRLAI